MATCVFSIVYKKSDVRSKNKFFYQKSDWNRYVHILSLTFDRKIYFSIGVLTSFKEQK